VARSKRKKLDQDGLIPSDSEPVEDPDFSGEGSSEEFRKSWARLIQKIYEVNPLVCPNCKNEMKIISVIEEEEVIKKILKHLGLWEKKARPPAKTRVAPTRIDTFIDDSFSQLPTSDNLSRASRSNEWLYVDPEYPETFPMDLLYPWHTRPNSV
jgi:hypothetical protein